jgi:hypothetical protein
VIKEKPELAGFARSQRRYSRLAGPDDIPILAQDHLIQAVPKVDPDGELLDDPIAAIGDLPVEIDHLLAEKIFLRAHPQFPHGQVGKIRFELRSDRRGTVRLRLHSAQQK